VALWSKSRREVDAFYAEFLKPQHLIVLDTPDYSPNYYAVFFLDPYGIRWELAHVPLLPSPVAIYRWWRRLSRIARTHPEWNRHPFFESQRPLPRKNASRRVH
jgi:hypothetical protein